MGTHTSWLGVPFCAKRSAGAVYSITKQVEAILPFHGFTRGEREKQKRTGSGLTQNGRG